MTEPEVLAVQQLAPQPSDESMTRTWYRITQLSAAPAVRRGRRWVPATAAAAVLVLAAATVTLLRVGPGTLWPVASTADAVATLLALAETAEAGAPGAAPGPGQLIFVDCQGWAAAMQPNTGGAIVGVLEPQPRLIWYDPNGVVPLLITDGVRDLNGGPKAEPSPYAGAQVPSLSYPTADWLAGLPGDPAALVTLLRREVGHNDTWTVDHELWDAMGQFAISADLLLTPRSRAALLRAFTGLTGLSVRQLTVDGRALVAIRHTDRDAGVEVLFDPATGRPAGRASAYIGNDVTITAPPGAAALDPGVAYQAICTQSVVGSVGARS